MIPTLIAIFAVVLIPFFSSLWLSLQRRDIGRPQLDGFVGLGNYVKLLHDPRFLNSLAITVGFSLSSVAIELVLGIAIAGTQSTIQGPRICSWAHYSPLGFTIHCGGCHVAMDFQC